MLAQFCIDQADAFEQVLPVHFGDFPQAGDDVAYRNVRGTLPFLGMLHHKIDFGALLCQSFLQPCDGGRDLRIAIAQPFGKLCGKDFRQVIIRVGINIAKRDWPGIIDP